MIITVKTPPPPRLSIESSTADDSGKEQIQRVFKPLYSSQRRNKREDTWDISLFVIFHLGDFAATIIVNDCWHNSHRYCALKPLGRFSFQPQSENPLLGPSASATTFLIGLGQQIRMMLDPVWIYSTAIHIRCIVFALICAIWIHGKILTLLAIICEICALICVSYAFHLLVDWFLT